MVKYSLMAALLLLALAGCTRHDSQNQYSEKDVGKVTRIQYGTVVSWREVDITGKNSRAGMLAGGVAGGAAGNAYAGHGTGKIWTTLGGALLGGVAGNAAEQALADHKGIEYTVHKDNGHTVTMVQNKVDGDIVFPVNAYVMIQTTGHYQRLLAADHPPEKKKQHYAKQHTRKYDEEDDDDDGESRVGGHEKDE